MAAALGVCGLVFILSFKVWNAIALPYSNPNGIVGPLSRQRFNPTNNLLRFLFVVLAPTLTWLLLFARHYRAPWAAWTDRRRASPAREERWIDHAALMAIGGVALLECLYLFTDGFGVWPSGLFDGGEDLVPAAVYRDTGRVWTGTVFIHGALPNIFKYYFSWALTGTSTIGAVVVANLAWSMAWFIAWAAWLAAAAALVRRTAGPLLAAVFVAVLSAVLFGLNQRGFLMNYREAGFFLVVALVTAGMAWRRTWLVAMAGALSVLGLAAHIDRAIYAMAISIVGLACHWVTAVDRREARKLALAYGLGGLGGCVLFVAIFGPTETGAFATITAFWIRSKDYLDSFVYPLPLETARLRVVNVDWSYLVGILGAAAGLLGFVALWPFYRSRGLSGLATVHAMVAAAGVIFYRNALGRSDFGHLFYSKGPAVLALAIAGVGLIAWLGKRGERLAAAGGVLALGVIFMVEAVSVVSARDRILSAPARIRLLVSQPDQAFMTDDVKAVLPQMKAAFASAPCTYVFTNAPGWYYFLDKPPCTRFYISWFAAPAQFQREIIRDLEARRPSVILYETPGWFGSVDGIRQADRLPFVNSFLLQHYEPAADIGGNIVYRLRQ